ncbi:MAG: glycosyltransferase family 2 protein [Ferruginibacter sp.]
MKPFVSVILPVYNQEHYLAETVESILAQTYRDFELIIQDDGSTDRSAQIIAQYAAKDNRIKPYYEQNAGKSEATNSIVAKAEGELCAFLDADDIMLPDRLKQQVALHKSNPAIDASSSHCYYINENGNQFGTQRYPYFKTVEECNAARINKEWVTCSFTALMVSKKAFLSSGGLRKQFEPCEDFEFMNRLVDQKYTLIINPVVLMKYRIHPGSVTVRKPFLIYDTISYTKHCIQLRRNGQPEISFKDFMKIQEGHSWWFKFNRKRFNYSRILFRSAGFAILSKNYLSFAWQIATSLILSPNYVFKKVNNFSKK